MVDSISLQSIALQNRTLCGHQRPVEKQMKQRSTVAEEIAPILYLIPFSLQLFHDLTLWLAVTSWGYMAHVGIAKGDL